jgi:GxxExxY protein
MREDLKYADLTHKIIGCAMRVHSKLGNGFQEVIYQRSLELEMTHAGIAFEREKEMSIYYDGKLVGTRRVDFFVENLIMVELKSIIVLEDVHLSQGLNYLEVYNVEIGLLINFGSKSLTYKRLLNKKYRP